jgi:uncharacterized membrane protein
VADSDRAKRVSIHNNYFTFPVLALMVSNHFPSLYGAQSSWQILLVLIAGGAAVRHILNVRYTTRYWQPVLGLTMAATLGGIYTLQRQDQPNSSALSTSALPPTFADARHIIDRRCASCHSASPTDVTFGPTPAGVAFDTPEEIRARLPRINERAVVTRTMPPANKTHITDVERDMLRRWISAGAPLK